VGVKPDQRRLKTPARAVVEKQDPGYSQADFLRDLEQVSQRRRDAAPPSAPRADRRPS
jgi:hypothetical protein